MSCFAESLDQQGLMIDKLDGRSHERTEMTLESDTSKLRNCHWTYKFHDYACYLIGGLYALINMYWIRNQTATMILAEESLLFQQHLANSRKDSH